MKHSICLNQTKAFLIAVAFIFLITVIEIFGQTTEIYVSDAGNFNNPPWQILKFDENGENPEVFTNSNLAWPQDIVFLDDQEIVLISNLNTNRITKYTFEGTYLGNFATGMSGPTRMKIGADSLLYVLQWSGTGKVLRYNLDGTLADEFTNIGVPQSIGLDWDSTGNLYVSSYTGDFVRKFDTSGTNAGLFISSNLVGPTNIWFDENWDLLVSDYDGTSVKRFDSSGNYLGNFLSGLHFSEGVGFFLNGDILIGNGSTSSVKLFSSSGVYIKDIIASGSGNLKTPNAVVVRQNNVSSINDQDPAVYSKNFILHQNYPNPFNPSTIIEYDLASRSHVNLQVLDVAGKVVKTLVNSHQNAGAHKLQWNGNDDQGKKVSTGLYFCRISMNGVSFARKMMLIK